MKLIDADALKDAIEKAFEKANLSEYEACVCVCEIYDKQIDNAPTVEPLERIGSICEENCGYRPQGEWITNLLGDYVCNKCSWVVGKFERNFCPNCGADMRRGDKE